MPEDWQIQADHGRSPAPPLSRSLRCGNWAREGPILLQDFAVVDDEATFQLDADGGFEHAPIHGSQVEDGNLLHGVLLSDRSEPFF